MYGEFWSKEDDAIPHHATAPCTHGAFLVGLNLCPGEGLGIQTHTPERGCALRSLLHACVAMQGGCVPLAEQTLT